jgi:hypothetical protein
VHAHGLLQLLRGLSVVIIKQSRVITIDLHARNLFKSSKSRSPCCV